MDFNDFTAHTKKMLAAHNLVMAELINNATPEQKKSLEEKLNAKAVDTTNHLETSTLLLDLLRACRSQA